LLTDKRGIGQALLNKLVGEVCE
jgi:hypothetical protein